MMNKYRGGIKAMYIADVAVGIDKEGNPHIIKSRFSKTSNIADEDLVDIHCLVALDQDEQDILARFRARKLELL
jgi:hypothetical protein